VGPASPWVIRCPRVPTPARSFLCWQELVTSADDLVACGMILHRQQWVVCGRPPQSRQPVIYKARRRAGECLLCVETGPVHHCAPNADAMGSKAARRVRSGAMRSVRFDQDSALMVTERTENVGEAEGRIRELVSGLMMLGLGAVWAV